MMVRIERFGKHDYDNLIAWIDSEELLVQIAGRQMKFPVTHDQLDVSQSDKSRIAFSIINTETNQSIGHCELYLLENSAKIDRVLIGDKSMKGKGICGELMKLLIDYTFNILKLPKVELNVFDWNSVAIRCYERSGFVKNPDSVMKFEINGEEWTAFNMFIERSRYSM